MVQIFLQNYEMRVHNAEVLFREKVCFPCIYVRNFCWRHNSKKELLHSRGIEHIILHCSSKKFEIIEVTITEGDIN